MSQRVYLSGPMRNKPRFNFDTFHSAESFLNDLGYEVFSPARADEEHGFDPTRDPVTQAFLHDAFRRDVKAILWADTIALLPEWEQSQGAQLELKLAKTIGLTAVYLLPLGNTWMLVHNDAPPEPLHPLTSKIPNPDGEVRLKYDYGKIAASKGVTGRIAADKKATGDFVKGEVRVTNATTGGAKGRKPARFDLLPARPLTAVAEHYGKGAAKYEDRNWERGYDWSLSFGALMRHAWAFWQGEDIDAETDSPHLAAVVFHALALLEFARTHPDLDDRPAA